MTILLGDCRETLATLGDGAARCCVTSPPYWGLRDYGVDGQIGLEKTPEAYVAEIVSVFREVRRVLADDGTLWLNLKDSYSQSGKGGNPEGSEWSGFVGKKDRERSAQPRALKASEIGLKPKDLVGIPWRVAFALQADGWFLRSDIIWHKPNPMPESVTDRPTKAHEYVFLLSKGPRYFYDAAAIKVPASHKYADGGPGDQTIARTLEHMRAPGVTPKSVGVDRTGGIKANESFHAAVKDIVGERNARTVWTIATQPTPDAHFATFPEALAERCILAGSSQGDTVLDPFFGSGTVDKVAERLGRKWIGCELNPAYVEIGKKKTAQRGIFV